jgi:hypothetical protein
VSPTFVDETDFDFHLITRSSLIAAGTDVADAQWGSTDGTVDLGAFGINVSQHRFSSLVPTRKQAGPKSTRRKGGQPCRRDEQSKRSSEASESSLKVTVGRNSIR